MSLAQVTMIAGTVLGLSGTAIAETAPSSIDLQRAYQAELAADAAARTSLAGGSRSGFAIASADGAGSLNIGFLAQMRYTANWRDDGGFDGGTAGVGVPAAIGDNDFSHGFNWQRARLDFFGNIVNPQITYRVSGDFSDLIAGGSGADFNLTWAYLQYDFEGGMEGAFVRAGSMKLPLYWEEMVAPEYQLAAERSLTNEYFSQQYSEAILFGYQADAWRAMIAFSDGLATSGTQYNAAGEADIAITGRAEVKFAGDWSQFEDFSSWQGSDYAVKVGGAFHWEQFGETGVNAPSATSTLSTGALSTGEGNIIAYTVDAAVEGNGWNLFAAFNGRYEETDLVAGAPAGTNDDVNDFGLVIQGGVFVTEQVELFGRWDAIYLDEDRFGAAAAAADDSFNFLTFGANYYFVPESHALKATLDLVIALDETDELLPSGTTLPAGSVAGVGALGGSGAPSVTGLLGQNDDTEFLIRAQLQMLF